MDRTETTTPRVNAALIIAGLWIRLGIAAAFAALSAPMLVARDALRPGDGLALAALGAALAYLAWLRTRALLGDETETPAATPAPRRRPATA